MTLPDDYRDDPAVAALRHRMYEHERELDMIGLQIVTGRAARELHNHQAWKLLMEQLAEAERDALRRLRNIQDPTPYWIARLQAYLHALSMIQVRPLSDEDLAKLADRATILKEQLAEDRNLLA